MVIDISGMNFFLVADVLRSSTSCSNQEPTLSKELDKPLICESEQQCRTMWERAGYFVNANAGFRVKVHNDTSIQTYNPIKNSTNIAFSIAKEPLGNGQYRIWTAAACANTDSCESKRYEMIARAKYYIRFGGVQ